MSEEASGFLASQSILICFRTLFFSWALLPLLYLEVCLKYLPLNSALFLKIFQYLKDRTQNDRTA